LIRWDVTNMGNEKLYINNIFYSKDSRTGATIFNIGSTGIIDENDAEQIKNDIQKIIDKYNKKVKL
jgi:hypothetical protein